MNRSELSSGFYRLLLLGVGGSAVKRMLLVLAVAAVIATVITMINVSTAVAQGDVCNAWQWSDFWSSGWQAWYWQWFRWCQIGGTGSWYREWGNWGWY